MAEAPGRVVEDAGGGGDRAQRSDARRNRGLVLAAAEAEFAEKGLRASIEGVARRAGVGVGTVCRHFPTKGALVEAVLDDLYASIVAEARAALERPNHGVALRDFFVALSEFSARHRAIAEQMASSGEPPVAASARRNELRRAMRELVARAQAAGDIRADVGPADVAMLVAGVAQVTALVSELRPVLRQRYVTIILDGLRPGSTAALPGRALDYAELDRIRKRAAR